MEAREVCKALPEGIRYGLETLGTPDEALALAATDLDTFMRTPSSEEAVLAAVVTMARMHAATLRDRFVPLGTKHNCLSLIRGIEKGQILELRLKFAPPRDGTLRMPCGRMPDSEEAIPVGKSRGAYGRRGLGGGYPAGCDPGAP